MGRLRDTLVLMRAPLAFTAASNGLTGYLLGTVHPWRDEGTGEVAVTYEPVRVKAFALAALASACLYWAGMALNDFFDRERDKTLTPFRPLPSGRVGPAYALALGALLLGGGIVAATLAGGQNAGLAAIAVALCVVAYDGLLKRWRLPGCVAMASCRLANVLLGAQIAYAQGLGRAGATALPVRHAAALGTFIFAVTLLSTFEDEDAPPSALALGFAGVLGVPIALGATAPRPLALPFLAVHLALGVALASRAGRLGTKATGHTTTRWLLRSLFLLDAAALAACGLERWSLPAVALLAPAVLLAGLLFRPPAKPTPPSEGPSPSAPPASAPLATEAPAPGVAPTS